MTIALGEADRGQTLPDFTVGIAIFLLTVAFVTLFVPQIIQPYEDQEKPVVAERVTSGLSNGVLVETGTSPGLNESATGAFFSGNETAALALAGVDSSFSMNVTLRNRTTHTPDGVILCDPADGVWISDDCDDGDFRYEVGGSVPQDDRSTATVRRTVYAEGEVWILEVVIW